MFALILALMIPLGKAETANANEVAQFSVSTQVVNADLPPFTATLPHLGNGSRLSSAGGFEPIVLRTQFTTTRGAPHTIFARPQNLTHYGSWRGGVFDGAEAEILRIVDGKFISVRRSKIPTGGHRASSWAPLFSGQVLPAGSTSVRVGWDGWNKQLAPYYFTVRALDSRGQLSPPAQAIAVTAPNAPKNAPKPAGLEKKELSAGVSALAAPQDLKGEIKLDRTAELSWSPVPGARGYMVYRSDLPPHYHRGYAIQLADDGPPIKAGDLVILRQRFLSPRKEDLLTNRVWGAHNALREFSLPLVQGLSDQPKQARWSLQPHAKDTPVTQAGETYLQANIRPSAPLNIGIHNHSGTSQTWYQVLDPDHTYTMEVWLRGDADVTVTARLPGGHTRIELSPEWQKHSLSFRVPKLYSDSTARRIDLTARGNGQISVDNFRIFRTDAPYMALLPDDLTELQRSGMGELRTHGFIKTGRRTYDLTQFTNPGGVISAIRGNTLPQNLAAIASANMDPWLQVEPHFSRDEWLGLVEYLAAPFDPAIDTAAQKPWAAKRHAQGQQQPYTQLFDQIRFEIGNETWNSLFRPWVFPTMTDGQTGQKYTTAQTYGFYQSYVLSIFQDSPYWSELAPILSPVIGGWTINSYGQTAALLSPQTPLVTLAEYNGGWDQGEGVVTETPQGFASVLGFAPQTVVERATDHVAKAQEIAQRRCAHLFVGTYEAGPGYARNGLNGAKVSAEQQQAQERVMKSAAAGTATLDTFLTQARAGYQLQNYFTFGRGDYWTSHTPWYRGGYAHPAWQWLSVLNREGRGLGDLLEVKTHKVPRRNLPALARRKGKRRAPMVDVYPLLKGDQLMLVVLSRLVPDVPRGTQGTTDITVSLPFSQAEHVTRLVMTGDMTSHNLLNAQAQIQPMDLSPDTLLPSLQIQNFQPGKAEIYIFDGIQP